MHRYTSRSRQCEKPIAVDLFSGCGGLSLGLKQAGFNVVGAVELNPLAVETYKRNHRKTFLWKGDIRCLSVRMFASKVGIKAGALDLLAGCPPCQGFSAMKTLNGSQRVIDPKQKDLLYDFVRFARVLKPKTVMLENVPGLAHDRRWTIAVAKLRKLGYDCEYKVLNAANYGVPQRRRRLILIGSRVGNISFASPTDVTITVRQTLKGLGTAGKSGDPLHDVRENRTPGIVALIKKIPKNGGSRTEISRKLQLPCHQLCNGFKDVYGRMKWDDVAPTITGGCVNPSKGRFLHPYSDRAITLREAAVLQTFPPTYYFSLRQGKFPAASLIGNALPPEFVRRHANKIRARLQVWTVTARTQ